MPFSLREITNSLSLFIFVDDMDKSQDLYRVVFAEDKFYIHFHSVVYVFYSVCIRSWSVTDCSGLAFSLLPAYRINPHFVRDIAVLSLLLITNSSKWTDCELEIHLCKMLRRFLKFPCSLLCSFIKIKILQLNRATS